MAILALISLAHHIVFQGLSCFFHFLVQGGYIFERAIKGNRGEKLLRQGLGRIQFLSLHGMKITGTMWSTLQLQYIQDRNLGFG